MIQTFYKTEENRWYVDLPQYLESGIGTIENLEMVAGADILLDIIGEGEKNIDLSIKIDDPNDETYLEISLTSKNNDETTGANYIINDDFEIWLCPVMLYVFGNYPEKIWFKKIFQNG